MTRASEGKCGQREGALEADRRSFLRIGVGGLGGLMVLGWAGARPRLRAEDGAGRTLVASSQAPWQKGKAKACILVWLGGGPSQLETWDPKPGHRNGGPTQAIATAGDFQIVADFPRLAKEAKDICLIRSVTSPEGDHDRASYLLHTGYRPAGALTHPSFGALVAKELGDDDSDLPHFVSIGGSSYGPGYLGVRYGAFQISNPSKPVPYLQYPEEVDPARFRGRMSLLGLLDDSFLRGKEGELLAGHRSVRQKALNLLDSPSAKVFDVRNEPRAVRAPFGQNDFGLQALMACRLVEKGVPFVEIHLGGWDTHAQNFNAVSGRAAILDPALSALIGELRRKGLLESTLVVCMGEFGRTPNINRNAGRDHFPRCFSVLLAGGGAHGGKVIGETSAGGDEIKERPVQVGELYATFLSMLRIDPAKEIRTAIGRSIKIADSAEPVTEAFG
jgi:hypothetical protein